MIRLFVWNIFAVDCCNLTSEWKTHRDEKKKLIQYASQFMIVMGIYKKFP
jgi:hypothetical protein